MRITENLRRNCIFLIASSGRVQPHLQPPNHEAKPFRPTHFLKSHAFRQRHPDDAAIGLTQKNFLNGKNLRYKESRILQR